MVTSSQGPSDSSGAEEARRAFFRARPVTDEGDASTTPNPNGSGGAAAVADAPVPPAGAVPGTPAAEADDGALPVFQDPEAPSAVETQAGEDTFTPPAWIDSVAPESREEALKFAKGQYERTQKERQRAGAAKAELDAKVQELAGMSERLKALEEAPPPVAVPELVLSDLRTMQEVDALVESAPVWLDNIEVALTAIRTQGEFVLGGKTYTEEDVPGILADRAFVAERLKAAPKRRAYLETYASHKQTAAKTYPDLFKPESAMAKAFQAKLKESPSLAAAPDHPVILADHLMMKMVRSGKYRLVSVEAPKATPAKTTTAPDSLRGGGVSPTPRPPGETADAAAAAELRKRADEGDAEAQKQLRLRALRAA